MEMKKEMPLTADRVERALDGLAEIMVKLGPEGRKCLPIYESIEKDLAVMRSAEDKMAAVRERAKRSKDRKASQLPA